MLILELIVVLYSIVLIYLGLQVARRPWLTAF